MIKPTAAPEVAPEAESVAPRIGDVALYNPPEYQARHVPGPWAAIVIAIDPHGDLVLAVLPPIPVPIGNDPVDRVGPVKFSASGDPHSWSWRKP